MLPKDFPPWQTVYWWFRRFMRRFLFETIHDMAVMIDRERVGREASPSGGVIDSQSVKAPHAEMRGSDAGKSAPRRRVSPVEERSIQTVVDWVWKLTSGSAGQPAGPKPRDKGRLGRLSDPVDRNGSEARAGLERVDADADPSLARGRPCEQGSNRQMHLFGLPGYWAWHAGKVMRVIGGDPSGRRSQLQHRFWRWIGRGRTGSYDRRGRVMPAEERTLTSGVLSTMVRKG